MWKKIISLFSDFFRPDEDDLEMDLDFEAVRRFVASEAMRTGEWVTGDLDEANNLVLHYKDGSSKTVPISEAIESVTQ